MPYRQQPDLFASDTEPDLFGDDYAPPVYYPDPDRVRARLQKILAEVRAAGDRPLDRESASLYQLIFPQMTRCLPDEEAAQLRFEFETEMARLEAAYQALTFAGQGRKRGQIFPESAESGLFRKEISPPPKPPV